MWEFYNNMCCHLLLPLGKIDVFATLQICSIKSEYLWVCSKMVSLRLRGFKNYDYFWSTFAFPLIICLNVFLFTQYLVICPWMIPNWPQMDPWKTRTYAGLTQRAQTDPRLTPDWQWTKLELSLDWTWTEPGLSLDWVWFESGLSLVCVWFESGLSLVWVWFESGLSLV